MSSGFFFRYRPFFSVFLSISFVLSVFSPQSVAAAFIPNDIYFAKQWNLRQIQAPEAWEMATGTSQVVVAVIDTGIDISHPELRENIWLNTDEIDGNGIDDDVNGYIDDIHGWNYAASTSNVYPMSNKMQMEEAWSHGTAVASIIAAKGDNMDGVAGVAWNVKIMPLVILSADGFGNAQDFARALDYAVRNGANIINMSFVGYDEDAGLLESIQRAHEAGVLLVAATGNAAIGRVGQNLDLTPAYPVCEPEGRDDVIGVGGSDTLDQAAQYGNYGARCTDLVAPSFELFTARPFIPWENETATGSFGYLQGLSGTSFAAPHVSGLAALIKSVQPRWSADEIKDRLYRTADSIEAGVVPGQKGRLGYGRINAYKALFGITPTRSFVVTTSSPSFSTTTITQRGESHFREWFSAFRRHWFGTAF